MKRSTILFSSLLFVLFIIASCQQPNNNQPPPASPADGSSEAQAFDRKSLLELLFNTSSTDSLTPGGRIVDLKDAKSCIMKYNTEMLTGGFQEESVTNIITRNNVPVRRITRSVTFRGKELGSWMESVLAAHNPSEVDFQMSFGMYDSAFVAKYYNSNYAKYLNRITIFIVPYTGIQMLAPPDDKVYNLGGLEP